MGRAQEHKDGPRWPGVTWLRSHYKTPAKIRTSHQELQKLNQTPTSVPIFDGRMHLRNVWATHCRVVKSGLFADTFSANKVLSQFTRSESDGLLVACKLFDEIPHKDNVTWNTMVSGFVNSGDLAAASEFHRSMLRNGFSPDGHTFASLFKGIAVAREADLGQQVHSLAAKMGYQENVYAGSALLDVYVKCGRIGDAYKVFQAMPLRNSVSWNEMIAGYVRLRDREFAFWMFGCMEKEGVSPDDGTFSPLMTLLDSEGFYRLALQLHCKILKRCLEREKAVGNALITSYSKCGSLEDAKKVFNGFVDSQDLVSFNAMLAAYLMHDKIEIAIELFLDIPSRGFRRDIYTYTSILSACSDKTRESLGKSLHGLVIKAGVESLVPVCNALMDMYIAYDNSSMDNALKVFNSMRLKDRVSWNTILTGFSQTRFSEDAIKFFVLMRSLHVDCDHYALSAALRSCSDLATLQLGQQIHVLTLKLGLEFNEFVASSLIFMYSKCGIIEDAQKSFEDTSKDSSIVWNSIMFAYAQQGQGDTAIDLFSIMRERGVKMDHFTFVAVLTACSHVGLVEQGRWFLDSMASDYGVSPRMEHYACAIDLYGRAGLLEEAKTLIESMPFDPDASVWKTMLGACRACSNVELATEVAARLLELEPEEHCTYVILANMYGHLKRWDEKASVTKLMRERKVKKVPGCSWIEINNKVHSFKADDFSNLDSVHLHQMLGELMDEIKSLDSDNDLHILMIMR